MTYYVAVDVGCIECGEDSHVLGIFLNKDESDKVCILEGEKHKKNWHGQHFFETFEVAEINTYYPIRYRNEK